MNAKIKLGPVLLVPHLADGRTQEGGWTHAGDIASSRTDAIKVARRTHRVLSKGGLAEWGHCPVCGETHWTVTVWA